MDKILHTRDEIMEFVATDMERLVQYYEAAAKRRFYIGETNITRKNFLSWTKAGLLPYVFEKDKWNKLSFIEYCWIHCIEELRSFRTSFEIIKSIKKFAFDLDPEEFLSIARNIVNSYEGKVENKEEIIKIYQNPEFNSEAMAWFMATYQVSPFMMHLLETVASNSNMCLAHTKSNKTVFVLLGQADDAEVKNKNEANLRLLNNETHICINLRNIVNNVLSNERLKHNDDVVIDFLNAKEKKIINEIREGNAREINIRFNGQSEPTHIEVKRNRISNETINKVARYLKKGNYQAIEFRTRNGQLIKYEETDIIKLDE